MVLRVAIVGETPADRRQVFGGVQAATAYLIAGLAARPEVELHVITLDYRAAQDRDERAGGVHYLRLATPPRYGLVTGHAAAQARLNRALGRLRPDVVHGIGTGVHAYTTLRSGWPALITIHGVQREDARYFTRFRERLHGWLQGVLIERYCVTRARHVIAISPYLATALPALNKAHLYPIPNPVANAYFDLAPDPVPQRLLYAGVVVPRKRLLNALQALAQLRAEAPGATLRVAGAASDPAYDAEVRAYLAAQGLQERVTLLGPLDEAPLLEEYRRAGALVLPSIQETTPMVVAQAMAAGQAVLATRVGGMADLVEDGVTGLLVPPDDIPALTAGLRRLLTGPDACREMGHRGREVARQRFSVARVAEETVRVYQKVAGGQP